MTYRIGPTPHIMVYDTTTQTIAATNTAQVITFNTTDSTAGISLVTSGGKASRITLPAIGTYIFVVSAVVQALASNKTCSIWFRKNGSDVTYSNTKVVCLNAEPTILAVNINLECTAAGDYYELWMAGTATTAGIYAAAATAGPPAEPGVPSIIVSVTQVA
jgi:hypothetical protein